MPDVVIAGGGIGGLAAALALTQRGADVRVLEQAPELKEIGAGVQISPNGTRILDALGLLDEAVSIGIEPDGKEIRLWNSGQTWPLFDLGHTAVERYGFPYLQRPACAVDARADACPAERPRARSQDRHS
jgi:salicylate hydroxylase